MDDYVQRTPSRHNTKW